MAETVSRVREELVTRRQGAYKARTEAAIKIQRWYRHGYRTFGGNCGSEESYGQPSHREHGRVIESLSSVGSSSQTSDGQTITPSSSSSQDDSYSANVTPDTSFERYVANELAIALVMSNRAPMSTLNEAQKERVRKLKEGMNVMTATAPNPVDTGESDLESDLESECDGVVNSSSSQTTVRQQGTKKEAQLSKIPVRISPKCGEPNSVKHTKNYKQRSKQKKNGNVSQTGLSEYSLQSVQGVEGGRYIQAELLPREPNKRGHFSSNIKENTHMGRDSSLRSFDNHLQGEDVCKPARKRHLKAQKVNVKSDENLQRKTFTDKTREHVVTSHKATQQGEALHVDTRVEPSNNFTRTTPVNRWKVTTHSRSNNGSKPPVFVGTRKPKYLVPLPQKKLARQKSHTKLKSVRKKPPPENSHSPRNGVPPLLVDAAVQTDDSDSSPSHTHLPLTSLSEQWSKPTAAHGHPHHTVSPGHRGTGSYSNVYAMKKQGRRKSLIRALQTPQCKPFEKKKKQTGYLQKYSKSSKPLHSTKDTGRMSFSAVYMEDSLSLLAIPQHNPLPELRRRGSYFSQAQSHPLHPWHSAYTDWRDSNMQAATQTVEVNDWQRSYDHSSMAPNHMAFWRRQRRTL